MRPEYERYRDGTIRKEPTCARLPVDLRAEAELIAAVEGDTISGLLIEGLARVVEDRHSDPNYPAKARQTVESQVQELETQLATARQLLGSLTPTPDRS